MQKGTYGSDGHEDVDSTYSRVDVLDVIFIDPRTVVYAVGVVVDLKT